MKRANFERRRQQRQAEARHRTDLRRQRGDLGQLRRLDLLGCAAVEERTRLAKRLEKRG
jgi:hypothetical protein